MKERVMHNETWKHISEPLNNIVGILPFVRKRKVSTATIQAEFYHQCRLKGIYCVLEYTHKNMRFDAVIIKNSYITHIVEVKNYRRANNETFKRTKQFKKYATVGVPILLVDHWNSVKNIIERVQYDNQ